MLKGLQKGYKNHAFRPRTNIQNVKYDNLMRLISAIARDNQNTMGGRR